MRESTRDLGERERRNRGEGGGGEGWGASFSREALVPEPRTHRLPLGLASPLSCFVIGWWTVPFGPGSLLCEAVAGAVPQGGPRMREGAVLAPSGGS